MRAPFSYCIHNTLNSVNLLKLLQTLSSNSRVVAGTKMSDVTKSNTFCLELFTLDVYHRCGNTVCPLPTVGSNPSALDIAKVCKHHHQYWAH